MRAGFSKRTRSGKKFGSWRANPKGHFYRESYKSRLRFIIIAAEIQTVRRVYWLQES